jgi:hypothetical protein
LADFVELAGRRAAVPFELGVTVLGSDLAFSWRQIAQLASKRP